MLSVLLRLSHKRLFQGGKNHNTLKLPLPRFPPLITFLTSTLWVGPYDFKIILTQVLGSKKFRKFKNKEMYQHMYVIIKQQIIDGV